MSDIFSGGWDPLEGPSKTDEALVSAAKKRQIKNILKSYVSNYDPFSELLQNALDAVERRLQDDSSFEPKISVIIDISDNSLEIIDNGCGFEESEFRSFLAPDISFKYDGKTRGNKGVGVTYIAYGFNELVIRTKNSNFAYEGVIRRGREWVEGAEGAVSRPKMEPATSTSEYFDEIDQGSSFKIVFSGKHIRPSNLGWYQAQIAEQWLYLLLVKTPLGTINLREIGKAKSKFDIIVYDKDGNRSQKEGVLAEYRYPHTQISASPKLSDVVEAQRKALDAGKDASTAIRKFKQSNGVYEIYDEADLKKLSAISESDAALIDAYKVTAYGYFTYSTEVWDQLNDKKAGLRKGLRIIKGGLQLANNHMPQGDLITIPLNKSIGHQNQTHVIVHFEGADPDLGRKGFQPELKQVAERISVALVRQLSERRSDLLKSDSGAQADIEKDIKVYDWVKQQERHEEDHPLVLSNENFFLPTKKISVVSVPQSEQDVIVLFNQLIAGGVVRGVRLLATSQVAQYDGIFRFFAEEPFENYHFDKESNPLGVHSEQLINPYQTQPKIIEYKFNLNGLIHEFESEVKHEKDIDLAVFWEMGEEYEREYSAISLLDLDNVHHRKHHGLTHILNSANSTISVICLRELIEFLNDPEGVQQHHIDRYGDGI